ncbi:MAG: FAD-dependent oxidoreductase [Candidatus Aminicenantes bacterium]|nr:FAD-dependent oxidoreductase [Candidatus Aminicenantes bacterium]
MRIGIVGNGLAGIMAAKALRELGCQGEIEIFARERHHYYPRPNLIDYLAGTLPQERVFAFPEAWYEKQRLGIHLGAAVEKISTDTLELSTGDGPGARFDTLLLCDGATAAVPPVRGIDHKGVFTLRTLDDAQSILDYLPGHPEVAVIGGGLLGLEIGRALNLRGARVRVVEYFDRLLPRQLDAEGADLLKSWIERMGLRVRLGASVEEVSGPGEASGLRLKDGEEIAASLIVLAAGVKPNIRLARAAGLETDQGLVVNDRLQTSHPKIFAAGDNISHRGRLYGIIPAAFAQARIAAANLLGPAQTYDGTVPSNMLKVAGLFVASTGQVQPQGPGFEIFHKLDRDRGIYKKIVLQDGLLVGAIWMGTRQGAAEVIKAVAGRRADHPWNDAMLEDDFDYGLLQ